MLIVIAFLYISCFVLGTGQAHSLPPAVQLGGAIVAAVEQDAEQELVAAATEHNLLEQAQQQLRKLLNNELSEEQAIDLLGNWTTEARGKHRKQKKLLKMLYPLVAAVVLAKLILLPLILKWLTALSASSFVMGKIALVTAGLVALKHIMSSGNARDRLEIIHSSAPNLKAYHEDLSSSGSSWMPLRQHYIPLGVSKDAAYKDLYKPFL